MKMKVLDYFAILTISIMGIGAFVSSAEAAFIGTATENEFCDNNLGFCEGTSPFTLSLATPTAAFSDGLFTLEALGDFDAVSEAFNVNIEGFDLGNFLNSDPGDDLFDNSAFGDIGSQGVTSSSASAIIPVSNLNSIVEDGVFSVTFTPVFEFIGAFVLDEFISYDLSFSESALRQVPEPNTFIGSFFAAVGIGTLALNRRKK